MVGAREESGERALRDRIRLETQQASDADLGETITAADTDRGLIWEWALAQMVDESDDAFEHRLLTRARTVERYRRARLTAHEMIREAATRAARSGGAE